MDRRPLNRAIFIAEIVTTVLLVLSFGFVGVLHIQALAELLAGLLFVALLFNTLKDLNEN